MLRPTSVFVALAAAGLLVNACSDSGLDGLGEQGLGGSLTGAGASGSGGGDATAAECGAPTPDQRVDPTSVVLSGDSSPFIVVDQFGYRPGAEKIAVIRDPQLGFDADATFSPGSNYELVDAVSGETVFNAAPSAWNAGAVHEQSGDVAWHFDFSSVQTPGYYYVRDADAGVRSDAFHIDEAVYRDVLTQAIRSFFYQRSGYEKQAAYAGANWADSASHVGPGQDKNARLYSAPADTNLERDVSGGWYDAGDMNKYTAWTADYLVAMARAYQERPEVFWDDYGLPDSGNCVPDLIDEMRFGLEHLLRLQEDDGSVLSIVDDEGASPPSSATRATLYGPASTNASIRAAAAYAWGARVLQAFDVTFAQQLQTAAIDAWNWSVQNPSVEFFNNTGDNTLGAGQQQPANAWEVDASFLTAAVALYELTADQSYKLYFEDHFSQPDFVLFSSTWISGYSLELTEAYLQYTALPDARADLVQQFLTPFHQAMASNDNLGLIEANADPYLARAADVGWGSNSHKSRIGLLLYSYVTYALDETKSTTAAQAAERFIHSIHGVNPLGLVYLSNMGDFGAAHSVTQFYHSWFADGTDWDEVGVSAYGPPPGFLVGGPNAGYNWDAACPAHEWCPTAPPAPPFGQPALKSYAQFNDNWPLNSWEVTENSNGYQLAYIRLLSKFVN